MPKLTRAVRVAAGSILLLSLAHSLFWSFLALALKKDLPSEFPYNDFIPVFWMIAAAGLVGLGVAMGILCARNWARISAIALGAIVGSVSACGMLVSLALVFGFVLPSGIGIEVPIASKSAVLRFALGYFLVCALAIWWVFLFSRKSVACQFSGNANPVVPDLQQKAACPPPIALLAWLMMFSSVVSLLSWPLILGRIPVMLFAHIFSREASQWIWAANTLLFLACGIGLIKLQRWSYTGAIALHTFWLVSLLFTQLSPLYETYTRICLDALELSHTNPSLSHLHFPQWLFAVATAIPTALLIAGLVYYRPSFLKAIESSRHPAQ